MYSISAGYSYSNPAVSRLDTVHQVTDDIIRQNGESGTEWYKKRHSEEELELKQAWSDWAGSDGDNSSTPYNPELEILDVYQVPRSMIVYKCCRSETTKY